MAQISCHSLARAARPRRRKRRPDVLGLTEHRFDDGAAPTVEGLGTRLGESAAHPELPGTDRPGRAGPSFGGSPRGYDEPGSGHRLDRRHNGLAAIAFVGEDRPDSSSVADHAEVRPGGLDHRHELAGVTRRLGECRGDDQPVLGHRDLAVVAVDPALPALHQAAFRIGHVTLVPALAMGRIGLDQAARRSTGLRGRGLPVELGLDDALPLGVGFGQLAAGLGETSQAARAGGQTGRQLVTPAVGPEPLVLGRAGGRRFGQDGRDLGVERGSPPVGRFCGIGGELGAIDRDQTDLGQAGGRRQPQDLAEQMGESRLVLRPEAGDRGVIGRLVSGDDPIRDVPPAARLDPA